MALTLASALAKLGVLNVIDTPTHLKDALRIHLAMYHSHQIQGRIHS